MSIKRPFELFQDTEPLRISISQGISDIVNSYTMQEENQLLYEKEE